MPDSDFIAPCGQTLYSPKHGVPINVRNPTRLMRPKVRGVEWE